MNVGRSLWVVFLVLLLLPVQAALATGQAEMEDQEPVLTMMFSTGGSGRTLANSAERFSEVTGIEVDVLQFPITQVYENQALSLSQGQPEPDVIAVDDVWFDAYRPFLEPLEVSQSVIDRFVPSMIDPFMDVNGEIKGLPVRMGGDVIAYRTDIFEEHGIDLASITTWNDVIEVAEQITDESAGEYGWSQGYAPLPSTLTAYLNFLSSHGGQLVTDDGSRAAFNSPEGVAALETMSTLAQTAGVPGLVNLTYNDQVDAFRNGTAVMGMLWNPRFTAINDPEFPHSGNFGVLPNFPRGEGMSRGVGRVYGWGLAVNQASPDKEAAQQFVEFVSSPEEQLRLAAEWNNSPTVQSVFENPEYLDAVPVAEDMASAMRHSIGRPNHPQYSQIVDILAVHLQRAVTGEVSAAEALADGEEEVNDLLSQ